MYCRKMWQIGSKMETVEAFPSPGAIHSLVDRGFVWEAPCSRGRWSWLSCVAESVAGCGVAGAAWKILWLWSSVVGLWLPPGSELAMNLLRRSCLASFWI